ncbi:hypothetical protein [Desulfosudis oleivorans]|nr:hypothetical protein [Desulfosudis oleivorans]
MNRQKTTRKTFVYENGRLYFSKQTERNLFFVLTLGMLAGGVLVKLGIL